MPSSTAATHTSVAASVTSVALFTSTETNVAREVFNDSTATLYLKYDTGASATSHAVQISPGGYFEFPQPTHRGVVHGIWSVATGSARCTERS